MFNLFRYAFWLLARVVLPLRYRIRVHGLEKLRDVKGPVLMLPNHPAYVDPVIVFYLLWPRLKMRPMVFTGNFDNPLFRFIKRLLNAHDIPNLGSASMQAREQAEQSIAAVIEAMKRGENHIIWPSGHVERDGAEHLGAARAAADILQAVPEATVVRVRTKGLFGSSFSWASGFKPSLAGRLAAGAGWILANLLFFMPRRQVEMTVEQLQRSEMPEPTREALNPWLEAWYNEGGPETPTFVPYHFLFGRSRHTFKPVVVEDEVDLTQIKPETKEAVAGILADRLHQRVDELDLEADTALDSLGLDSIDRMEITLEVERQFGFTSDETPGTVGELYVLAQGLAKKAPPKPPPPEWFQVPPAGTVEVLGDTIPAAFVARALANRKDIAVADDLSGALTYEQMLVGVLIMARRFAELPGKNIGLLLPASAGSDIALLALHMAGKLPVILNWTTGPANLAHAAQVMKLSHVITSRAFIDRTGIQVVDTEYLFLENVRKGIGFFEKVRTLLGARFFPARVRSRVSQISTDEPAVVLFTSGSERAPKAVPLTHGNIISDQRLGLPVMGLTRQDVFLAFLPTFHSFGLTVTGLLPILSGMRVVRHPDPTDAGNLARKTVSYGATVLLGTPTFLSHILERARPGELPSLRLIVAGAEKCPPSLFDLSARVAPQATVVEGYGITECAPVVSINPPAAPRPGSIGKPFSGIDVRVVDLDSGEPLPGGQMGMLQVNGPTVFPGYIDYDGPSPFVEQDGKRWYVTGDLGEFDADGYLWFRGRLKRFIKSGGEMISLPALEEPFAQRFPPTEEDGPRVAVEGVETDGGRRVVLFTTENMELRDANALLGEKGFQGVMRLDEVRKVDRIPTLGTGKTDYKVLRAQILDGRQHEAVGS
jgi:acyl-CoA synthetase (AMP-forming)/AMP-acid ligase II/acyl carrier protein